MYKIIILLAFLISPFFIFSQENINNSFNISISIKPIIDDGTLPRGISLSYSKFIKPYLSFGVLGRVMNQDYTSLCLTSSYIQHIGNNFGIPVTLGAGLQVKNIELSDSNNEGLEAFFHAQTGLEWYFTTNWSYTLNTTYNYDIFNDNSHTFFINLGMTYLF